MKLPLPPTKVHLYTSGDSLKCGRYIWLPLYICCIYSSILSPPYLEIWQNSLFILITHTHTHTHTYIYIYIYIYIWSEHLSVDIVIHFSCAIYHLSNSMVISLYLDYYASSSGVVHSCKEGHGSAVRCPTSIKSTRFRSQLEASHMYSHRNSCVWVSCVFLF